MNLSLTATARVEIDKILDHIRNENPSAATSVGVAINSAIRRLAIFPHMGAATNLSGVYVKIVRPYRYLIFYGIDDETVVIRNVRHPARRSPVEY